MNTRRNLLEMLRRGQQYGATRLAIRLTHEAKQLGKPRPTEPVRFCIKKRISGIQNNGYQSVES